MSEKEIERRIEFLETHYSRWNEEFGEMRTDIKWVKNSMGILLTTITGVIGTLLVRFFSS